MAKYINVINHLHLPFDTIITPDIAKEPDLLG